MVAVRPAARVSDEKRIRGVYARCAIQIDTFTFFTCLCMNDILIQSICMAKIVFLLLILLWHRIFIWQLEK